MKWSIYKGRKNEKEPTIEELLVEVEWVYSHVALKN